MKTKKQIFDETGGARNCPSCRCELVVSDYNNWVRAERKQTKCRSCSQKGKQHTLEQRKKISESVKKTKGNAFEEAGKKRICPSCQCDIFYKRYIKWWEATKLNRICKSCSNSLKNKGRIHSDEFRKKCSALHTGRKHTEEVKKKLRISKAERFLKLNIGTSIDAGSQEYFDKMISEGHKLDINKYFKDIGYFADAYDYENHIWYEYDTLYHKTRKQKEKDLIRQNNIIEYFKSIQKPLTKFVRIILDENNNISLFYI